MKDKKKNTIIILCLVGIIICVLSILVLKLIELSPKKQFDNQLQIAYDVVTRKYGSDKKSSKVTDGKYTSKTLLKNKTELNYVAEFDIKTDKLIHFCLSDGSKLLNLNDKDITMDYIKSHTAYKRSTDTCELN